MKAIGIRQADALQTPTLLEVPIPAIDRDEVLARVHAVGVGVHDGWALPPDPTFPSVIGLEGAGTIVAVGDAVSGFTAGDRVMFFTMPQPKGGTWAEFVALGVDTLVAMPDRLSFTDAAALPVAGTTALESVKALGLTQGQTVFIAGASGAIGTLAIQLAARRGLRVAASASTPSHEHLRAMGASFTVDYRDPQWTQQLLEWMPGGVDAALAIQPGTGQASLPVVRSGGKVVTVSGDQVTTERMIAIEQMSHHPETRQELAQLAADVATGDVRVVVDSLYPFEEGCAALEKARTRHARGKIILTLTDR